MLEYHYAWLSIHPDRTEEWLRQRLADGFDIHHMDGNHQNNDPANLALIEHVDHMRLHNNSLKNRLLAPRAERKAERLALGAQCYAARSTGTRWKLIDKELLGTMPDRYTPARSMAMAKAWAEQNQQPWPIPI